jgi:hypothetical protein
VLVGEEAGQICWKFFEKPLDFHLVWSTIEIAQYRFPVASWPSGLNQAGRRRLNPLKRLAGWGTV